MMQKPSHRKVAIQRRTVTAVLFFFTNIVAHVQTKGKEKGDLFFLFFEKNIAF